MILPTAVVRQATNAEIIQVIGWQAHELQGGLNGGVYRVSGMTETATSSMPWSLILKIPPTTASLADPFAGTRESVFYRSSLLQQFPDTLGVPRCFEVIDQPMGGHWLWLEDIGDDSTPQWSLAQYGDAAFRLGQFNGAFLAGTPLPTWPWITFAQIVRDVVDSFLPPHDYFQAAVDYAVAHFGRSLQAAPRLVQIYAERHWYLDVLERLPQTLCHGDADRRNFMVRQRADGGKEVIVIDWAWVGRGVVGQDVGRLVNNAIIRGQMAPQALSTLDGITFTTYLRGLQEAGWQGDPRLVRCGYAVSIVLAEGLVVVGGGLGMLMDSSNYPLITQILGGSMDDILARTETLLTYYLALADEAHVLWSPIG